MGFPTVKDWGVTTLAATTATAVIPAHGAMRSWIIQNQTGADLFVGFDNTVTNSKGFKVTDGNVFQWDEGCPTGAVYAYSVAGGDVAWAYTVNNNN